MRKNKKYISVLVCFTMLLSVMIPGLAPQVVHAAAPTITGLTPLQYLERDDAVLVAPNVQITGGGSYDDSYMRFSITNSTADETLSLVQSNAPVIDNGVVSVVGTAVYLGNGTAAKQIGTVNSTQDGQQGRNLQIDFSTPLVNGDFEDNGGSADGWTVNKNRVVMGELATKTQARAVTKTGTGPYTITGINNSYSFVTDYNYDSVSRSAWGYEGDERPLSYASYNSAIVKESENNVLRLYFSGNIDTTTHSNSGRVSFGSSFGPEAISSSFAASQGDTLAFDWKAANGGDDYEVYGFLYNVNTQTYTELMYGRGYQQNWITAPGSIPADGTYQFRFITGSYDRTGGYAIGASLYIDNVRVFGNYVNDEVAQKIARLVTYHNSSSTPNLNRTITIEAETSAGDKGTVTNSVTITPRYFLTYNGTSNGSIQGNMLQKLEEGQTGTPVTAVPDANYHFIGWSDGVQTATRTDSGPNDVTVTANFASSSAAVATVETHYNVDNVSDQIAADTTTIDRTVTVADFLQNLTKNQNSTWKVVTSGTTIQNATQFDSETGKNDGDTLELGDKLAVKAADGTVKVYTIVNGFAGGLGTADRPYEIKNAEQLNNVRYGLDKHYKLTGDVDLSVTAAVYGWAPIGDQVNKFTGNFDGNGYIIDNLNINRPDTNQIGLFGYTDNATISNVGLKNVNVTGGDQTGRLIGQADNTTITNSYAAGTVTGAVYTGGLVGQANGVIITNTYGTGSVVGTGSTGGLVGEANGTTVNNSYYDSNTTTQSDNIGKGTPKTTAEMRQQATFAGWDFNHIWTINEGLGYPEIMPRSVTAVTAPSGATITGTNITANVSNSTNDLTVNVTVNKGASWKLYSDANGTTEITDKKMNLIVGENKAYIVVTAKDGVTKVTYSITINRAVPDDDGGSSSPVVEQIEVNVEEGSGNSVSKATIERTTASDGTKHDKVELSQESAQEAVNSLKAAGQNTARIVIPDAKDEVSEVEVSIPLDAVKAIADGQINLEIVTDNAIIRLPNESLQGLNENVFFRIVPIKEEDERREVEQRARTEQVVREVAGDDTINVVGRPMTIETNLSSRAVDIILPLRDVVLPTDEEERQAFLNDLVIFIEHSDGDRVLAKGEVITLSNGTLGIEFRINKFSTFTIIHMENWEEYLLAQEALNTHTPYILGYPDNTFRPDLSISRAEMAALLSRVVPIHEEDTAAVSYPDVLEGNWAYEVIQKAKSTGLMQGYTDGTFGPNKQITRAEMAVIVARWLQLEGQAEASLTDTNGHWAESSIALVNQVGIMKGMPDGTFLPNKSLSRAEAVATINRILKRAPLTAVNQPSWQDVSTSHWAFGDIEEASKEHPINLHTK